MKFLGSCRVCGRRVRNYVSLSQHLRFNPDLEHQKLKEEWHSWREDTYRSRKRCWKCGELWEITDKKDKDKKRCPRCEKLKISLSKRKYEALRFDKKPDTRKKIGGTRPKAKWYGIADEQVQWKVGDDLYLQVVKAVEEGELVRETMNRLGLRYKTYREIAEHSLGSRGYQEEMGGRKSEVGREAIKKAHEKYRQMSPEEKAQALKIRFGKGSSLEKALAKQLTDGGVSCFKMNVWQSVPIRGKKVPREADIKLDVGGGRKVVIFCDGEAFHGPRYIFGDAQGRIDDDIKTAESFFGLGYSVLRYSETEIKEGEAIQHLLGVMGKLEDGSRIYRTWHPPVEKVV